MELAILAVLATNFANLAITDPAPRSIRSVEKRNLRASDPNYICTLQPDRMRPVEYCMGVDRRPSISTYTFQVQILNKHTSAEEGQLESSSFAKSLRVMLHSDVTLRDELFAVAVSEDGNTLERVHQWQIAEQRYLSDEVEGVFGYISNTTIEVTTTN